MNLNILYLLAFFSCIFQHEFAHETSIRTYDHANSEHIEVIHGKDVYYDICRFKQM